MLVVPSLESFPLCVNTKTFATLNVPLTLCVNGTAELPASTPFD
jgi:hypothetical protein